MLKLLMVLCMTVAVFGWMDEDGGDNLIVGSQGSTRTDTIPLNIIDQFQLDPSIQMLGLDYDDHDDLLGLMDNDSSYIRAVETGTGTESWSEAVPYSETFGTCHDLTYPYGWWVNSWATGNLYYWDGVDSWGAVYANPAGDDGRGMDFDESGYIWQAATNSTPSVGLYRINAATGTSEYFDLLGGPIVSRLSGLTYIPYAPHPMLVVTCYTSPDWYFYEYDGTDLSLIGTAIPQVSDFDGSRGLTFSSDTGTIFWSYKTTTSRWIAEVEFNSGALQQSTWGNIKTQF